VPGKIERSHSAVVEVRETDVAVPKKKLQRRWSNFFGAQYEKDEKSSKVAVSRPSTVVQQTMRTFNEERRNSRGAATLEEQRATLAKLHAMSLKREGKKK